MNCNWFQLSIKLITILSLCGCGTHSIASDELNQILSIEETSHLQEPLEFPTADVIKIDRMTPVSNHNEFSHYQGGNPYRSSPKFDVAYDPEIWELTTNDYSRDIEFQELLHRELPDCSVHLTGHAMGAEIISTVPLGEHQWRTYLLRDPHTLGYSVPWEDIAFIFSIQMPEPYPSEANEPCIDAAEEIFATFKVLPD